MDNYCRGCGCDYSNNDFCFDCDRCRDCCSCHENCPNEDGPALTCPVCHRAVLKGEDNGRHTCHCLFHMMSVPSNRSNHAYPHFNWHRTFGVEIECYGGRTDRCDLQGRMRELAKEKYGDCSVVCVGTDPSIHGPNGLEIRIGPVCGDDGLALVARVLLCLRARRFTVNETCGLHVHHDLIHTRRRKGQKMIDIAQSALNFYGRYQSEINHLCRSHRNGCDPEYCSGIDSRVRASSAVHGNRYSSLNISSLHVHGTLEFRQHHATVVPASVIGWILFTQLIVEKAARCKCRTSHKEPSMRELWRRLVDPKDKRSCAVRKFFLAQARHLAGCERRAPPRFSLKKREK